MDDKRVPTGESVESSDEEESDDEPVLLLTLEQVGKLTFFKKYKMINKFCIWRIEQYLPQPLDLYNCF